MGDVLDSDEAMEFAIQLAYKGWGLVAPNPMVGCVVLDKDAKLLSFGNHECYGEFHAEVNALKNIDPQSTSGGHIFVSLEPCSHQGKTPPCADLVAKFGFAKLTVGALDINPLVSGRGLEQLKAKGLKVDLYEGTHSKKIEQLHEEFFYWIESKASFWSAKIATSIDGKLALKNGQSRWITNEKSREHVHYLRAGYSAVAVGKNTILKDDPQLNVRHKDFKYLQKKLLIFTQSDDLNWVLGKKIMSTYKPEDIVLLISSDRFETIRSHGSISKIYFDNRKSDFHELSQILFRDFEIHNIFVEAGQKVLSLLFDKSSIHRLYHFQAPVIIGSDGLNSLGEKNFTKITDLDPMQVLDRELFGSDLMTTYKLLRPN